LAYNRPVVVTRLALLASFALLGYLAAGCRPRPIAVAADPPLTPALPSPSPAPTEPAPAQLAPFVAETGQPAPAAAVTATPPPAATAAPATEPPQLPATMLPRRLTTGGCCWQPFFLDGRIAFLDRPAAAASAGVYAVPLTGGPPLLVESRLGAFLNDGAFFTYLDDEYTVVERRADGQQWRLLTNGQPPLLSPDGSIAAWMEREWEGSVEERRVQFWWKPLDGGRPAFVTSVLGGGLIDWLADGRWLAAGRLAYDAAEGVLFTYVPASKERLDLFQASWFRGVEASPDGRWVIFLVGQDPVPERNGLWLVRTDGGELRRLDWFGAYAWRDASHLFYLPFRPGAASDEVWLYDVAGDASQRLGDPALPPFRVAQGDFFFTPDGRALVYVSAADHNLWLLPLPDD
jgi:hypothetical protein